MTEKLKNQLVIAVMLLLVAQISVGRMLTTFAADEEPKIIINEIAWSGSLANANHEWIELYNAGEFPVDLSGWTIVDDLETVYEINEGSIGKGEYFLIADNENVFSNQAVDSVAGLSLANSGDSLVLKNPQGENIDIVNSEGGDWFAGGDEKASMERIDPFGGGDEENNWGSALHSTGVLDADGNKVLGTPGGINSSFDGEGPTVSIETLGDIVLDGEVDFVVNVDQVDDLYAYGFDLVYDSDVLEFVKAVESDALKQDGSETAFNFALENGQAGKLLVGNARLQNPATGINTSGELFTATFKVLSEAEGGVSVDFEGKNFLSDSTGEVLAKFENFREVEDGDGQGDGGDGGNQPAIAKVKNVEVEPGEKRYSLEISWDLVTEATSYQVRKQMPDETFVVLGETEDSSFIDSTAIVPGLSYHYKIFSLKDGVAGEGVEVEAADVRGITGDLDRSDRVDGKDIELIARYYGGNFGNEGYVLNYDLDFDGVIDGSDLIDIGANFGLIY